MEPGSSGPQAPDARSAREERGCYAACLSAWLHAALRLEAWLRSGVQGLGTRVARRPWRAVAATVALTGLCALGFLRLTTEARGRKLWTPQNSESVLFEEFVASVPSWGQPPLPQEIVLATRTPGANLLNVRGVRQLFDVFDLARNLSVPGSAGASHSYETLCARRLRADGSPGDCLVVNSVLQFWGANRTRFEAEVAGNETRLLELVSAPALPSGLPVLRRAVFGGLQTSPDGALTGASALSLVFLLRSEPEEVFSRARRFEETLESALGRRAAELSAGGEMQLAYRLAGSYDRELTRNIGNDIHLVAASFAAMTLFLVLTLGDVHPVRGRLGLSCAALVSFGLATISAYGLGSALRVPFISLHQVLFYIIVGIGCDDVFVLCEVFDRTDKRLPIKTRAALAARHGGVAISVTSFTNTAAFAAGAWTIIPAIQFFCVYACLAFFFLWLYAFTFFLPFLMLDERRRDASRVDCLLCCRYGRGAPHLTPQLVSVAPAPQGPPRVLAEDLAQKRLRERAEQDSRASRTAIFLRDYYAPVLLHPVSKAVVILLFGAALGAHLYGVTRVDEEFRLIDVVPDDSYLRAHNRLSLERFGVGNLRVGVYFRDVDLSAPGMQQQALHFIDTARFSAAFEPAPLQSWLHVFVTWYRANATHNATLDASGFLVGPAFYEALRVFLGRPQFYDFGEDLYWNGERTSLLASRAFILHVPLPSSDASKEALRASKALAAQHPLNAARTPATYRALLFNEWYVFMEQFLVIFDQLVSNLLVSLTVVMLIATLVLVHPGLVLIVTAVVAMMDAHILGSFWWWGLSVNSVTVIQLVMAVGLIVDYNLHISHLFLLQPESLSRDERVRETFFRIGSSVLLSGASTLIGVLPLAFANSEIFRVFFKCFVSIVGTGLSHGMILLPVLLSLIGPALPVRFAVAKHASLVAVDPSQSFIATPSPKNATKAKIAGLQ